MLWKDSLVVGIFVALIAGAMTERYVYRHRCVEKALEDREEAANVVLTGTVRQLMHDQHHPYMMKGEVEIKRIMKGNRVVDAIPTMHFHRRRQMVMVDGFGDPHICDSKVRPHDTRIFLLNRGRNGDLRLNSSLVRVSLNNLERTGAAIKNAPYRYKPVSEAPCERKYCPFYARCLVDKRNNKPYCKCPERCSSAFLPVCGTDGVTYSSECRLRVASCSQQRRIKVRSKGHCNVRDPCTDIKCEFGAKCIPSIDSLSYRCVCPDRCDRFGDNVGSEPVCGDDGKDYTNTCELEKAACQQMKNISPKYEGKCDPCDGHQCPYNEVCLLDKLRQPICSCNFNCKSEFTPVCGSNGRTYSNECYMKKEACKKRMEITKQFLGSCNSGANPCNKKQCRAGEFCQVDKDGKAKCVCPPHCERMLRPVCGSDGVTYDNECELRRQSCIAKKFVSIAFRGHCAENNLCQKKNCSYGGVCVVKNGVARCECAACSEEFKPVCGSDGVSYNNECKLKAENCAKKKRLVIRSHGLCNGCSDMKCDFYAICESDAKGNARCVCPRSCHGRRELCGTDGITYENECELKKASCHKQQYIIEASKGPCDLCAKVKCGFGGRCVNGKCECPTSCPNRGPRVCANDGKTYRNECEMRKAACQMLQELEVVQKGECTDSSGSGDNGSGALGCDEILCNYGGVCQLDAEDEPKCVCNFNCEAVRSQVCGSDGRLYSNDCQMREESCKLQKFITTQDKSNCDGFNEDFCDGNSPLVNESTGSEYRCSAGSNTCPQGSYCHIIRDVAKCCKEEPHVPSCLQTEFGCCPDEVTPALGRKFAGCPSICQCNPLGSYGKTCDKETRQCTCKPGVGGRKCDRCEPGFWGLHKIREGNAGCMECGCNIYGSVRSDCEQMTGRCVCKLNVRGNKCNLCSSGKELTAAGCDEAGPLATCTNMQCRHGSVCQIRDGKADCVCPNFCANSKLAIMVCGSDEQTYGSECLLKEYACRRQRNILVLYEGACRIATTANPTTPLGNGRSRKTTRHIGSDKSTPNIINPTVSTTEYGLVGDICLSNRDCIVQNSYCRRGLCTCEEGYTVIQDNTVCSVIDNPTSDGHALKQNPCYSSPCQRGGTCILDNINDKRGYKCLCPLPYGGPTCVEEDVVFDVPSFSGKSFLKMKRLMHVNREVSMEIAFRTLNSDCMLLYAGQQDDGKGDFISLAVKDGFVEFRYDLGGGPLILRSRKKVVPKKFHHVIAKRFGREGLLQLDNEVAVRGSSPGQLQSLNVATPLYLGYVSDATKEVLFNVGVKMGLVGCIKSLKIHSKDITRKYDLHYPRSKDIISGAGIGECGDNPCSSLPCKNGGTCMKTEGDKFECKCVPGWQGAVCSLAADACASNPCQGESTCAPMDDGFMCKCPMGREGIFCEKGVDMTQDIFVPEFHRNSFIERSIEGNVHRQLSFEVWFLTRAPNGLILYSSQHQNGKGDFISLNLVSGYLQFRFDLGSGIANLTSPNRLTMNVWHRVVIKRINRSGTMVIDGGPAIKGKTQGELKELNLGPSIFIGGYHGIVNPDSGVTVGLHGAIQRMYDNDHLVENLLMGAIAHHNLHQYMELPCYPINPCRNRGVCVPKLNEYECRCTRDYSGKRCENGNEYSADMSEKFMAVKFNGRTFYRYYNKITKKQRGQKSNRYDLKFKTRDKKGLILIQHKSSTVQGDYLAIGLNHGYAEVIYNLGKQTSTDPHILRSAIQINDGKWHMLSLTRDKRKATLKVDGLPEVTEISVQGATQLDTDGFLWIGGKRSPPRGLPDSLSRGFKGCLASVLIDNEPLDLVNNRKNHGAVETCKGNSK